MNNLLNFFYEKLISPSNINFKKIEITIKKILLLYELNTY